MGEIAIKTKSKLVFEGSCDYVTNDEGEKVEIGMTAAKRRLS
jgi:hypothetical protein